MKSPIIAVALLAISVTGALGACPPLATGPDSAVLAANQQRLFCQHQEIHDSASQKQFEAQVQLNRNAIQQFQLQRRFDMLPKPLVVVPTF